MLIRRDITEEASETKLSDCELLLRKYLDTKYAQIDTLFVLAQVFERHDNNASKLSRLVNLCQIESGTRELDIYLFILALVKETFNELYEINVIDIEAFMRWKDVGKNESNYPIILAATK